MTTKPRMRLRLSLLVPLAIGVGATADALTRLIPLDYFAFRGWEGMVLGSTPSGPFAPNKTYHNRWAYGDLANLGNYQHLRQYRDERFTTDSYGFRNPLSWAEGDVHIEAILDGDSFSAGGALSDEETLAAQLTALTGKAVYNAAGPAPAKLVDLLTLRQRLKMERGIVIYQFLERLSIFDTKGFSTQLYQSIGPSRTPTFRQRLADTWADLRMSRAEILIRRAQQALREGEHNPQVVLEHLVNGDEMAFFAGEIVTSRQRRALRPDFFKWLADELAKNHLELLVVLVPNKYTVYEPLLMKRDPLVSTATLDELEERLRQVGVRVVNLAGLFRERAATDFKNGEYLYWRDDTHWNGRGVRLAAERIRDAWP